MLPLLRSTIVIILVTFHFKSCSSNHTLSALHYSDLTKLYFSITNGNYQLKLEDQTQLEWSLTNVDGIPILSNDVKDLLLIKTKEFILPILDEIQTRNGGFRLLGFVNVKLVEPKSLTLQIDGSLDALTYEIVKDESMSQSNEAETKISQPQSSSLVKLPSNSFQEIKETITFENKTTTNDISNNYVTTQQQQQLEDSLKQNQSSFESETPLDSKPNMKFNVNSEADDLDNLDELYGPNKKYPEPFLAGKMPSQVVKEKHFNQTQGLPYSYSVRFRSGPLGIIFDNKIPDATIIERVVEGQPAYESGVQAGDRLVAVNEHDTVNVPAKVSMRLLSILPFPKILVFQTKVTLNDPKIAEAKIQSRTYNMTIFYPPHLANHYTIRISEWSKHFDQSQESVCPILYLRTPPSDMFGCEYPLYSEELDLPQTIKTLNSTNLSKNEDNNQMISLLLEEANRQHQSFEILSTGIVKRGICTFVEKTQKLQQVKAKFGIVINTDNELIDMPAGKEITNDIHIPVAMIREHEGDLIHLTSSLQGNDVIAMITSPGKQISSSCSNLLTIAQDITDNWAHSYPYIPSENILNTIAKMPPRKIRTKETEGGRIALGGENGWAYFDYHLALFGPTLLPSGPLPFKLAQPIYGCDPNKYTVRIADHVVGIMRGGGCSFGIKIINAQKLGAKAVVIINNDDSPVIRLMALKDEIALIKIPCVMVARRMLTYVEQMIKPFYRYGQYVITMESTSYLVDGFSPPHLTDINMRKFPNFASCLRIAHSLSKPESDIWGRLSFKIEQEQKFRILVIGGSTTGGVGCIDGELKDKSCSWSAKFASWIRSQFTNIELDLTIDNQAVGGLFTGSAISLTSHFVKSDIIFIDFAEDDAKYADGNLLPIYESFLYHLKKSQPLALIFYIITCPSKACENVRNVVRWISVLHNVPIISYADVALCDSYIQRNPNIAETTYWTSFEPSYIIHQLISDTISYVFYKNVVKKDHIGRYDMYHSNQLKLYQSCETPITKFSESEINSSNIKMNNWEWRKTERARSGWVPLSNDSSITFKVKFGSEPKLIIYYARSYEGLGRVMMTLNGQSIILDGQIPLDTLVKDSDGEDEDEKRELRRIQSHMQVFDVSRSESFLEHNSLSQIFGFSVEPNTVMNLEFLTYPGLNHKGNLKFKIFSVISC